VICVNNVLGSMLQIAKDMYKKKYIAIKFCFKVDISRTETSLSLSFYFLFSSSFFLFSLSLSMLQKIYEDDSLKYTAIFAWYDRFYDGRKL